MPLNGEYRIANLVIIITYFITLFTSFENPFVVILTRS